MWQLWMLCTVRGRNNLANTMSCRVMAEGAHVIWYDNFTKYKYSLRQIPDMEEGSVKSQLWTGRAFRASRVQVDMSVRRDQRGCVIPAMPDDPLIHLVDVSIACRTHSPTTRADMQLHETCLLSRWQVYNVPLCPHPDKVVKQRHARAIRNHSDGLDNLHPDTILPVNITANKHFLRLMREHYEGNRQHLDDVCPVYSVFATDIDIANKQLRVQHGHLSGDNICIPGVVFGVPLVTGPDGWASIVVAQM